METRFSELSELARDNGLRIKLNGNICHIELDDEFSFYCEAPYHEKWSSQEYLDEILLPRKNALEGRLEKAIAENWPPMRFVCPSAPKT